jgi:hypothetical protein
MKLFAALGLLAVLAAGCGGASVGGGTSATQPGSTRGDVAGRYLVRVHLPRLRHAHPGRGVLIGVYRRPVIEAGPVPVRAPRPLAQAVTGADGRFRIAGLEPGRYFLLPRGALALSYGRWVRVRAGEVAHVRLVGCGDCMRPLNVFEPN